MTASPSAPRWQLLDTASVDSGLAWVFPGQGSQAVGMGLDLFQASAAARAVFGSADAALGFPLSRLCFEGPEEQLRQTVNAQPAIVAVSLACLAAALEADTPTAGRPAFLAGHSLGEYTALVVAGSLGLDEALWLVRERGRLMQEAGRASPGAMAALMGLAQAQVEDICRRSGTQLSNLNSPAQFVIGGSPAAVEKAMELARRDGGRATLLNVSGAFHTSLMGSAACEFARIVDRFAFRDPGIAIVANATARPLTSAAAIVEELKHQLIRPVLWQQSVEYMAGAGVSTFIEIGPGRVLSGLIKRIDARASVRNLNGLASLAGQALRSNEHVRSQR